MKDARMDDEIRAEREGLDIAIVGMAGRFPGASNVERYWNNLRGGVESVSTLTEQELLAAGVKPDVFERPNYVRARALLNGIDLFDARFFNMTPKEAEIMDPQHRLLMECAWETLESAGYIPETYSGSIGVYAGSSTSGYLFNLFPQGRLLQSAADMSPLLGVEKDSLSTRVSYKLNLEGPSLAVQTACSTSLVAVHLACQALLSGECDMALAGGVSITVPQKVGYLYQEGGIASPDGHCRAFDAEAEGTVGGSGVGLVLLKRLQDAEADGDHILAVIKGSAINNDGASKVGYTAPSIEGQVKVIRAAQVAADVAPDTITYIEAHGTGTPLGDPIEIAALTQAFQASTNRTGFCAIGSVKTNIGHLDAAAGIAGLIKTVLALSHRQIPPTLHFVRPNPGIDLPATPFHVNRTLMDWPSGASPRRAAVSSFGLGGTNAHVILEEAPPFRQPAVADDAPCQLLVLSARSEAAVAEAATQLATHLRDHASLNLADVAHTLQAGRKAFPFRRWVAARSSEKAALALSKSDGSVRTAGPVTTNPPVWFMFSGQGAQYPNMGRLLYDQQETFRECVDRCATGLHRHLGLDIRTVLFPKQSSDEERLHQTALTQPALFVLEYALVQLWAAWGIRPQAMIGHSLGEYVAACVSGVFTLEDALAIVALRGRLMQEMPPGSMLAVPLTEAEVVPLLRHRLDLAAVNAPAQCVLSGPDQEITAFQTELGTKGIQGRRLKTSHAFHSAMMDPILKPFESFMAGLTLHPPLIPWVSNVTGKWIRTEEATDPSYWSSHLRSTVRFSEGLQTLRGGGTGVLLEVGPGRTLQALAQRQGNASTVPVLASFDSPLRSRSEEDETASLLSTLGSLWGIGVSVDWAALHAGQRRHRVPLPTYPFERQRYWVEPPDPVRADGVKIAGRSAPSDWCYQPSWKRSVKLNTHAASTPDHWLVFAGEPAGECIANELKRRGHSVTTVQAGTRFEREGNNYRVRPDSQEDHDLLMQDLTRHDQLLTSIVHAWTIGAEESISGAASLLPIIQEKGFLHLLLLARTFGRLRGARLPILVLSDGIHEVTGDETLAPEKATLLGACLVIPQEYPGLMCRLIDLDRSLREDDHSEFLTERLLAEISALDNESIVAYRGKHRWVQTFEPLTFSGADETASTLREGGVYLITGGIGGVGLALAEYLAHSLQARLILTSRSLPTPEQRNRLATLERSGAQIVICQADVADSLQMRTVVTQAIQRFGSIHGVIHAAGIAGGGLIELKTSESVQAEFRPKVTGTQVLNEVLRDVPLDFLMFCSSLTAVTGGIGQVAYCAANNFLDAAAQAWSAGGRRVLSVNFDRWRQVGMAVQAEARLKTLGRDGAELDGMTLEEALHVFRRVFQAPALSQVVVSIRDLSRVLASTATMSVSQASLLSASGGQKDLGRLPEGESSGSVERYLTLLWQEILGVERVGLQDDFFALGGESLNALQILNRLQEVYRVDISLRQFFDAPTVSGLAAQVSSMKDTGEQIDAGIVPLPRQARRLRGVPV